MFQKKFLTCSRSCVLNLTIYFNYFIEASKIIYPKHSTFHLEINLFEDIYVGEGGKMYDFKKIVQKKMY